MTNAFFERPILNSPYEYPARHWELGPDKQPTQRIVDSRRRADFVMPIPAPKKRKGAEKQTALLFDERSTQQQQYDHTAVINAVRTEVDKWRALPNPNDWRVTPETVRLLQHWRHHAFSDTRPFFCQVEAAETAIWLTEVAPQLGKSASAFLDHLANANQDANPGLSTLPAIPASRPRYGQMVQAPTPSCGHLGAPARDDASRPRLARRLCRMCGRRARARRDVPEALTREVPATIAFRHATASFLRPRRSGASKQAARLHPAA